jgi:hypothetical protein
VDAAKACDPFRNAEDKYRGEAKASQRDEIGGMMMYKLLVSAMLLAALSEVGISLKDFENCHSRQCVRLFQKRIIDVLRIDWHPITVFPEEARSFE